MEPIPKQQKKKASQMNKAARYIPSPINKSIKVTPEHDLAAEVWLSSFLFRDMEQQILNNNITPKA